MIKKYRYDGDRKFKLSKVETDETSLEPDRKKAEAKMQKIASGLSSQLIRVPHSSITTVILY